MKPTASSFRLTSRKGSGLGGTDLDLGRTQVGQCGSDGWSEVERQGLTEVDEGFLFCVTLASHVNFETLGDVSVALLSDASGERALHNADSFIVVES